MDHETRTRIDHHLRGPGQEWQFPATVPACPGDAEALAYLRDARDRACTWLERIASVLGMPMPRGNGPCHYRVVLDQADRVGIIDISAGRIAWTDQVAPSYVAQFARPTTRIGTAGVGSAARLITLRHGVYGTRRAEIDLPNPVVTSIEWGVRDDYGRCGTEPVADDWRTEWGSLVAAGVPCRETTAPQWEQAVFSVAADLVAEWAGLRGRYRLSDTWYLGDYDIERGTIRTRRSNIAGQVDIEVCGTGDDRRALRDRVAADFRAWARAEVARQAAQRVLDLMRAAKLPLPTSGASMYPWHGLPFRRSYRADQIRDTQRLLGAAMPDDT